MLKKSLVFIFVGFFAAFSESHAACTLEDVEVKSQAFVSELQAIASGDHDKYIEAMEIIEQSLPTLQDADNIDAICKFYDDWLEKVK